MKKIKRLIKNIRYLMNVDLLEQRKRDIKNLGGYRSVVDLAKISGREKWPI